MAVTDDKAVPRHGPVLTGAFLLGLLLVFVGQRIVGEAGLTRTLLDGFGAALAAGALVMRILSRGRAPESAAKVETLVSALYAAGLAGLGLYALSTPSGLELLGLGEGDAAETVAAVLSVLWVAVLAVTVPPILFIELSFAGMPVAGAVELRRIHLSAVAGATLGLAATYLFAANYAASEYEVRRDLSYFRVTDASESTLRMVERLDEPVEVVLFYPEANEVLEQLEPYFDRVAAASDRITVRVTDQVLAPALAREHQIRGNGHVLLLRGEQGEAFEVGTEFERARRRLRTLDGTFQRVFLSVTRPPRVLYTTVGHGERTTTPSDQPTGEGIGDMDTVVRQVGMQRKNLGLAQGLASAVPEDATVVVVPGPTEDFLPEEAASLQRYAENGGRLLLLLEPNEEAGLGPVLDTLGLRLEPGTLAHEGSYVLRTHTNADRYFIYSNRYSSHPSVTTVTRNAKRVATIFFGAGHLSEVREKGRRVNVTIRALTGTWADLNGNHELDEGQESRMSYSLAAAVTIPEEGGRPEGRDVVVADVDVFTDQVLLRSPGNLYFLADVLRWLVGDEELAGEVENEEDVPIEHTRDQDVVWFYGTVFVVPAAVVALGIVLSVRRRRRSAGRSS